MKYLYRIGAILFVFVWSFLNGHAQSLFNSGNLPIVIIDTQGGIIQDEPKIPASMGIIDNGPGALNNLADPYNDYNGMIGIEYRGSSSQALYDKKNFGIETWDENLQDTSVSILGMPPEEDWVLHGPFGDKSLIRNLLAFKLGRDLGHYASRTRLCELVLNGEYRGVYVFMEKVKRDNDRIDISQLNPDENSGNDLTGGYIIKLDKFDGGNSGPGWESPYPPPYASNQDQSIFFQYEYPRNDEISSEQMNYIQQYITAFEDALRTKPLNDEITGYRSFIDVASFIDYFIINEITRNIDGYRLSTFMFKDKDSKDGRLYIGPIWDYNLAFGNADYCDGWRTDGWAADFNLVCNEDFWLIPFWWQRFMADQEFTAQLSARWETLRSGPYRTETILQYIDSTAELMNEPAQRNFSRWNILGTYVWPNSFIGNTYAEEINFLKEWIRDRLTWLDSSIPNLVTGIADQEDNTHLRIYPNPFNGSVWIETDQMTNEISCEIYNTKGLLIRSLHAGDVNLDKNRIEWDGRDSGRHLVSPGLYFMVIRRDGYTTGRRKIIKK